MNAPLPDHDNHHNALLCPYCNPNQMVLVPKEPTVEMLQAAYDTAIKHLTGDYTNDECLDERERANKSNSDYYHAMLAARPK